MFRILVLILSLLAPTLAAAQALDLSKRPKGPDMVLKSYTVELDEEFQNVSTGISQNLGHILEISEFGEMVSASYSGFGTPEPLSEYLLDLFPALNPELVSEEFPISLSIAVMAEEETTLMRIMMSVPNDERATLFGRKLPEGGTVLMDDSYVRGCLGQTVLSHASTVEEAATTYSTTLTDMGFTLTTPPHVKTSFFVGRGKGCALFLYIQPDFEAPDQSLVVVRFTED